MGRKALSSLGVLLLIAFVSENAFATAYSYSEESISALGYSINIPDAISNRNGNADNPLLGLDDNGLPITYERSPVGRVDPEPAQTLRSPIRLSIYLSINSTPQGAQIWIDGKNTGKKTPDKIYFNQPGNHTLKLTKVGYRSYQESIYISGPMIKEVILLPSLASVSSPYVSATIFLEIISKPQGAHIWIDGENTGKKTPYTKYFNKTGSHTLMLILDGYQPHQESINISRSMTKEVTLVSSSKTFDRVSPEIVTSIPTIMPTADKEHVPSAQISTTTPASPERVTGTRTSVRTSTPTVTPTIITPMQTDKEIPVPTEVQPLISVYINSNPQGADIWIDGKSTGKFTPAEIYTVAGSHIFEMHKKGYEPHQESSYVFEPTSMEINLTPEKKSIYDYVIDIIRKVFTFRS